MDSLATQLRVARSHEADLQAQLATARHAGVASENVQAELTQLQQDAATRRDLYRTLLERAEQTVAEPMHDQTPDVRVLSQAVTPGLPSSPNVKAATGLGGIGGGLLAGVFALAFTRRGAVLDPERPAGMPGLTLIATLRGKAGLAGAGRGGLAARIVVAPAGDDADAMRVARARLGQIARRAPRKIAFAGAASGLAGSAAAAAFARVAALDGQRVLLVDVDRAHRNLALVLGASGGKLEDVLSGAGDWRDAVTVDSIPGLDVLLGARSLPAGGDAVALENLLAAAGDDYDLIVLGAPAAAHPDALGLARSCDVTVLVIEARDGEAAAHAARTRLSPMSRSPPGRDDVRGGLTFRWSSYSLCCGWRSGWRRSIRS